MKRRAATERPTLDLMEEAIHLLRSTPLHVFGWYLLGVLPFLLALLYFWMEMSWSALASQHRTEASLGVAAAFLWMKCAQAVFAGKLHARLARQAEETITLARLFRLALFQTIIQPSKLFLLPLAALATIPYGWLAAFYENATVLGASGSSLRGFIAHCWRQATFWPRQNHCAKAIYLLLFLIVFLNLGIIVFLLPHFIKMFTGFETIFTRGGPSVFNTTFFAIIAALTYLVCDPLSKAVYTLRCFYGESVRSGADLVAAMRALPALGPVLVALALLVVGAISPARAAAPPPRSASVAELDRAIQDTARRPEFSWKLPRQPEAKADRKWPFVDAIERFFKACGRAMKRVFQTITNWLDKILTPPTAPAEKSGAGGWASASRFGMIALLVLLIGAALALLAQTIRQIRLRRAAAPPSSSAPEKIDLEDPHVTADLLPEDEWLALARAHLAKGEVRLVLRAFFLAGLAHLAGREILLLARHKSNRDYERELQRKAREQTPLLDAFGQNIVAVERVWYGRHEIDSDGLRQFEANLELIRAC